MKKEKVLIIVESPGKIQTIKKCLPDDKDYIVLASIGHIADLSNKYKYNLGIDIDNNFKPNYIISKDKVDVLNKIIDAASISDLILMATDDDREGECIASLIADRLQSCKKPIKRIVFKEIKQKEILNGINNQRDIDKNLVDAAMTRRALDRIVGYMASPFVIKNLGKGVSAGRVQSVALKLVVERENQIETFVPEEYWNVKVNLGKDSNSIFLASLDLDIKNKESADSIKTELDKSMFVVCDVENKAKPRKPPEPLITSRLQMLASSKYKLDVSATMETAQSLYEAGHISYMRTDSRRLSDEIITDIRSWINSNHPNFLPKTKNVFKNKASAQDAHEAIRPTDISKLPKENPQSNEEKVYKLIWDITVASQMTPAIYNTTSVKIITNKNKKLKLNGRVLFSPGWLTVTTKADIEETDDKDNLIPILNKGDKLSLFNPGVVTEQKFTQPPSRYKVPTLIEELEKKGIGRPATYAAIMTKICETRGYVDKKNDVLHPTLEGRALVGLLNNNFTFMNYEYTSEMEDKLELICQGECTYTQTIKEFFGGFNEELIKANVNQMCKNKSSSGEIDKNNTGFFCEKCRYPMNLKESSIGYFLGCSGYPHCKNVISCKIIDNVITPTNDKNKAPKDIICPDCDGSMIISRGKFGDFYRCESFPQCKGKRKIPYGKKCPECGGELFRTVFMRPPFNGPVLGCMEYPKCNHLEKLEEEQANWKEKHDEVLQEIKNNVKNIKQCTLAPATDI